MSILVIFGTVYSTVFAAEIIGDKLLYTTAILVTKCPPLAVIVGTSAAFMVKMAVAVAVGQTIADLPPLLTGSVSAAALVWLAVTLWRKPEAPREAQPAPGHSRAALISFWTILFAEWGDLGQLTSAILAVRFPSPFTVWLGAVAAMCTKAVFAAAFGTAIRRSIRGRLSVRSLRLASIAALIVLGVAAAAEPFILR